MKIFIFLSFFIFSTAFFNPQELEQSKQVSHVKFKIKNLGINVYGSFSKVSIDARVEDSDLANSFIKANIQVSSIETGIDKRDEHVLEEDYFDKKNYKTISLVSSKIDKISDNSYQLKASLTIKNTAKQVIIPFTLKEQNGSITIASDFEINRKDYGIGGGSFVLGKTVKISVSHTYTKQ